MGDSDDQLLGYLEAKLDALHEDIKLLQEDVSELKTDFLKRKAFTKIVTWMGGFVASIVTGLLTYYFHSLSGNK